MSIKPILFNTDMVQAILEGRKTVTRRVVKYNETVVYGAACAHSKWYENYGTIIPDAVIEWYVKNIAKPQYQPGDILYVRETWRIQAAHRFEADARVEFKVGGPMSTIQFSGHKSQSPERASYDAFISKWGVDSKWRPSIHMPKEAARTFLRVTGVRPEQLRDMTEESAKAEGFNSKAEAIKAILDMYTDCTEDSWFWVNEFEQISREEALR